MRKRAAEYVRWGLSMPLAVAFSLVDAVDEARREFRLSFWAIINDRPEAR